MYTTSLEYFVIPQCKDFVHKARIISKGLNLKEYPTAKDGVGKTAMFLETLS